LSDAGELEQRPFAVERDGMTLAGESLGEGPPVVLLHGLTANRRYVVHGSRYLPRHGYRTVAYDARGHGSSDPAPADASYTYRELSDDLGALLDQLVGERRCALVGSSMGAHTIAAHALGGDERVAAIVLIGPAYNGVAPDERELARWDRLAAGLEQGGAEGFVDAFIDDFDPRWRDTQLRIARDRLSVHEHPEAVARALREVPRSRPFDDLAELEFLDLPALVVASRDEADPEHPQAVAEAWAERLPSARLASEEEGASPLAWQGGRLSREISRFLSGVDLSSGK
jgi:pimeloyl-ACP methyl ester carboxylesterase